MSVRIFNRVELFNGFFSLVVAHIPLVILLGKKPVEITVAVLIHEQYL
jgi:hypothetical protein